MFWMSQDWMGLEVSSAHEKSELLDESTTGSSWCLVMRDRNRKSRLGRVSLRTMTGRWQRWLDVDK